MHGCNFSSLLNWVQRNENRGEIKNPSREGLFDIFWDELLIAMAPLPIRSKCLP
jgi:hypothetical protein